MLDIKQREALMVRLNKLQKKATSSVSTKVEAKKGDFSVVVTADTIDHFYQGNLVGNIRVSSLDSDTVEQISSDPQEAAQEMLEFFASSFDKEAFQKEASSDVQKEASSDVQKESSSDVQKESSSDVQKEASQEKTAAHETLDDHTWQMTTQKQLDDQKPSLHPRTDDYPKTVTQKQIPEDGQRPGTYEIITEGQFRDETATFYSEPLDAGKRKGEDRNRVTEGQFDEGVNDYSEVGQSERAEMGSKFDGDLAKQQKMIGEKQIAELLKHHEWTEPLTITEGRDQLPQQDGELSRLTAEVADKIIKEALSAMGKTILAAGVTPKNLVSILQRLVSHPSKYPVLADTLSKYVKLTVSQIQDKVANAQYFGKVANASSKWSNELIADVLVRQLSKMSYSPQFVVEGLVALSQIQDLENRVDQVVNDILKNKTEKAEESDNLSVFAQVLDGKNEEPVIEGDAKDGMYEYTGTIEEVKVSTKNKEEFHKAARVFAENIIKANIEDKNIELKPLSIHVDEELGTFKMQMKDASFKDQSLEARASKRRDMAKKAQFGGGGGMPAAGGDQMGNPMAPAGGGDMGAPPAGESFSQEPPMDDEMGGDVGGEPKPPGAICPVDGSEDVDVDNGEFRCNSCGAEGTIHVQLDVSKWPETINETGEEQDPGFGLGAEDDQALEEPVPGGEGVGTTMPNVPIAASVRLTHRLLEKIAEQKIEIGKVCPNCGGHNTDLFKSANSKGQHGVCYNCMQEYNVQIKVNPKKAHNVYAQFTWVPKTAQDCSTCGRLRNSFVTSLNDYGVKMGDFEKLSMQDKAEIILKMAKSGTLSLASGMSTPLPMDKYAASFKSKFDKFPSASCRERIARKFGENATAMSGPCQGKSLQDCVCNQLEDLGIYTDGLAAKVAHVMKSEDPMIHSPSETCVKMLINDNYGVKEAITVCDGLRASSATDEELIIEAIAQFNPAMKTPMPKPIGGPKPMPKPMRGGPKPMAAPTDGMETAPMPKPMPAKPMLGGPKPMMGPGTAPDPLDTPAAPMEMAPGGVPPMPAPPAPMEGVPIEEGSMEEAAPMEMAPGAPAPMPAAPAPMEMGAPAAPAAPMEMGAPAAPPAPMEMGAPAAPPAPMPGAPAAPAVPASPAVPAAPAVPAVPMPGLSPSPMDEPIMDGSMPVDDAGDGHLDVSMEGDMGGLGDEMGGFGDEMDGDMDMGLEGDGDLKTIIVEGLQSIIDALGGNLGDDMFDTTGDDMGDELGGDELGGDDLGIGGDLDVGEITEDTVEDDGDDDNIPGVMNDEDEGDDDIFKSGDPEEESHDHDEPMDKSMRSKPMDAPGKPVKVEIVEAKPMEKEKATLPVAASTETMVKEASTDDMDRMLYRMKCGTITKSNEALDNLFEGLLAVNADFVKSAAKTDGDVKKMKYTEAGESKLTDKPCQDATDIGKIKDGGTMGHEEKLALSGPDVARGDALIGEEDADCKLNDSDRPSIPHGSGTMAGEGNYTPEKGNVIDGNQGGGPMTSAAKASKRTTKVAFTINQGHKIYDQLNTKLSAGKTSVKLTDGKQYDMGIENNSIILTEANKVASKCCKKCAKPMKKCECSSDDKVKTAACSCGTKGTCDCGSRQCPACCDCGDKKGSTETNTKAIKESQTVSPKSVDKLEDDPDLNPSSGPGAGKTHADEAHSLGIDEKKPSEGMSEPSVPEAPDGGQLAREHTYDNALDGPEIPAGGGMNPDYDQNEKNTPEKLDQTLGKENDIAAMAAIRERATKIAGQLLKSQQITVDELPDKIAELAKSSSAILDDYENMMKAASSKKGLQKAANVGSVETSFQINNPATDDEQKSLKANIQGLFGLDQKNKDYESHAGSNPRLWR